MHFECVHVAGLRRPASRLQSDRKADTRTPQHLDERIDAEQLDSAANEITHSRLRHPEEPSGTCLGQSAFSDELLDRHHEARAHQEVARLGLGVLRASFANA